jgi:hypothetical protein
MPKIFGITLQKYWLQKQPPSLKKYLSWNVQYTYDSFNRTYTFQVTWLGCPFFASNKKMRNEAKKMQKQTLSWREEAKLSETKWDCFSFAYMNP